MKKEIFELPKNYSLAWQADFSKPLDTELWHIPNEVRKGGYWSSDQVLLQDNQLIIRTEYIDKGDRIGYHSAELCWETLRSTYGYYEIKCKVDNIRGAWSAFWLMPDDISKESGGVEIDIFENAIPHLLQTTLHSKDYKSQQMTTRYCKDFYEGFHVYGLDWKKDGIKFYYDNKLLWHVKNPKHISHYPVRLEVSTEVNGFNGKPHPLFWPGNGTITNRKNKNKLPYDYVIDYIKVYDNGELEWSKGHM